MGKFKRLGRTIPSLTGKKKKRPWSRDIAKTLRCGQLVKIVDVVPLLKWMYADGGVSFNTIESITGIGVRTIRRLVRLTDADPPLRTCEVCLKIAYTRSDNYCSVACYRKVHPKVRLPQKPPGNRKPCVYNLSCGNNVLKTSPHGLCATCRDRLPERKRDRHLKALERERLRAEGLLPPVTIKFCDRCSVKLSHNNTSGVCLACRNT